VTEATLLELEYPVFADGAGEVGRMTPLRLRNVKSPKGGLRLIRAPDLRSIEMLFATARGQKDGE
jgi:hypothetical protein